MTSKKATKTSASTKPTTASVKAAPATVKLNDELRRSLAVAPTITPSSILAAVRRLDKETAGAFDIQAIADEDAGYGSRLRVLKALLGTDKVVVKDAEPARLKRALLAAVGAKNTGELALKCASMIKTADKRNAAVAKADAERTAKERKRAAHEAPIFDGKPVLPATKRLGKKARAAKDAAERAAIARELRHAESEESAVGIARPRPDATVAVCLEDVCLLEDPSNGVVLMRLEEPNSQGAICVYNNGSRVAAGVVPTETLNRLRRIVSTDMVRDVNQLLHPCTAGVTVTPVAERHLTAVLEHCKENIDMATKKAAEIAAKTKKFEAPKGAAKKAAKETKAVGKKKDGGTERKSSLFRLLNDTKKTWEAFTTQKATIIEAFVKLGAVGKTAAGATRAQLVAALPGVPDKNVSFYLSKWQPAGIVEKLPAAE
jgi:hypothetical protein